MGASGRRRARRRDAPRRLHRPYDFAARPRVVRPNAPAASRSPSPRPRTRPGNRAVPRSTTTLDMHVASESSDYACAYKHHRRPALGASTDRGGSGARDRACRAARQRRAYGGYSAGARQQDSAPRRDDRVRLERHRVPREPARDGRREFGDPPAPASRRVEDSCPRRGPLRRAARVRRPGVRRDGGRHRLRLRRRYRQGHMVDAHRDASSP